MTWKELSFKMLGTAIGMGGFYLALTFVVTHPSEEVLVTLFVAMTLLGSFLIGSLLVSLIWGTHDPK